jgi:methyl-accepting chemotaxis protein
MLKNLTIGTRIALGFGLMLIVTATVVLFSIRGLRSSGEGFETYLRLARSSVLSGRVQANMLLASNAAERFLKTRDESQREIYEQRLEDAKEQLERLEDPTRRKASDALVSNLERLWACQSIGF